MNNFDLKNQTESCYYADEIKMLSETARNKEEVFVIVESKNNEKLFKKVFTKKAFFISAGGYKEVSETIDKVNYTHNVKGCFGIIDADFNRILNQKSNHPNIFLTDGHDTEILMINSNAWNELIKYHSNENKLETFEKNNNNLLKNILFNLAQKLSCLRLLNERDKLGLKFKTKKKEAFDYLDYSKFVDLDKIEIDMLKMIQEVENKSLKQNFFTYNKNILEDLNKLLKENFDLNELTNGHDIINILSLTLESKIGNLKSSKKKSGNELEDDLIKIYRYDDFIKTNLYIEILNWQTLNIPYKVFS